jgi:hypothetical protein
MRDVVKLYNECVRDLKNIGIDIPTEKITEVFVNGRMTRAYGKTYRRRVNGDFKYRIAIITCVLDENVPSHVCRSIMYHEAIHTLEEAWNLNKKFHEYCVLIEDCLGVKMGTYVVEGDMAEIKTNTITPQRRKLDYKWEYHCPKCGGKIKEKRRPSDLAYYPRTHEINYCCSKCKCRLILDKHGDMSKVEYR